MLGVLMVVFNACSSKNTVANANITNLLKENEFTFMAQRANPTNSDVVNVINSLPNSASSQILNLDTFYMDNINYFLELVIHFLAFSKSVNSKCLISAAIKCFPKS